MNDAIPREDEAMESLVAEATNEFMDRVHRGEQPDVEEFARRYPPLAGILRRLLPAVQLMDRSSSDSVARGAPACGAPEPLGCLGDFQLLREIGRGGMGVVYEAKQISLGRRVALKVLPLAAALDPRQLQRFRLEAQAAAHLHHSHIVPIYSVGCERSVHFYAMQYIEGRSLAEVIAELRQPDGVEGARLPATTDCPARASDGETSAEPRAAAATVQSIRHSRYFQTVAALGVQAAEALDYAHGMGVVHRDVKPPNLLLDAQGSLYVTDFGLAQLQGVSGPTMTGDQVGTLRYMSPEQALGQRGIVDHRTDIYSLGTTLYELLTLAPAFDAPDRHALLRQIAEEEPISPRRRNSAIPVDLETIVLKAMAKEPERRYAAGKELADDLRRFLEHRPILARRPTLLERAAKWSRRHRALVGSAAAVLLLAAVGLAASTVLIAREQWKTQRAYEQITAEQARTKAAYEAEAEQRVRAQKSFHQAREAVDFLAQIGEAELAGRPELQGLRRKLLEAALAYYKDFIDQRGDDPSVQAELMESHLHVAGILEEIGSKAEAQAAYEKARQIEARLPPEHRPPFAVGRGPPRAFGPPGMSQESFLILLLAQKPVQEEVKLSEVQATRAAQLAGKRRDAHWEFPSPSPGDGRARLEQLASEEKALVEGLQPKQARRLRQIALQQRGPEALGDPEAAAALRLTAEQKEKIGAIQARGRQALGGHPGPGFGGHGPEERKKREELWRNTREQLLQVLTAAQRAQWDDMLGEPFPGEIPFGFGARFGPGRGFPAFGRP